MINTLALLKNTTGAPIVVGSITIPATGNVPIWDTVDYNPAAITNLNQVLANPAIFNERIGNGTFVLNVNSVDLAVQPAFDQFFLIKNANLQVNQPNPDLQTVEYRLAQLKEPNGFPNRIDSTYSINNGTRTFTIQPVSTSYDVWIQGTQYVKTTAESVVWSNVEGLHVLYFDTSGVLSDTTSPTAIESIILGDGIIVAAIYWDVTNSTAIILAEERHGILMDSGTHYYLHTTNGSRWVSGGDLFGFVVNGGGTLNSHAQFTVNSVKFSDEDIEFNIIDGSPQELNPILQAPIFYLNGTSAAPVWRKKTADNFPLIYSGSGGYTGANGRAAWNQFNGSNWLLTEAGELDYFLVHYYACNDVNTPVIGVLGQVEYPSIEAARRGARSEVYNLQNILTLLSKELVNLGSVIFSTSSAYINTPKALIVSTDLGTDYIDTRQRGAPLQSEFETASAKLSVAVATIANITLSGTQTIDTVALTIGSRVLVKDQSNPVYNGLYVVQGGAWVRTVDFNQDADVLDGAIVYVRRGSANINTSWALTTPAPVVVGSTALTFLPIGASISAPSNLGTNTQGVANRWAREDHVHAHGNLTGSTLHNEVSNTSAGFAPSVGSSGTALVSNGTAATWQAVAALTSSAPTDVTKAAAVIGVSTTAARSDHKHDITTAAASALTANSTSTEGSATSLARSDHTHAIGSAAAVALTIGTANATGTATTFARSDHTHSITGGTPVALTVGGSNAAGVATTFTRSDHTHSLPAFGSTIGTFAQGNDSRLTDDRTASGLRTATTVVAISSATAPVAGQGLIATSATAATWQTVSTIPDNRTITAGAGLTGGGDLSANRTINIGANADGSITVNADDIQVGILATDAQHGTRGGGTLHAAVSNTVAGFAPAVGASGTILNSTGTAAQWSTSATLNLVTGPASSTDLAIPRFNGATGKIIQNSSITINATNQISGVVTAGFAAEYNAGNSSTAATINWNNGQKQVLTLTGSPAVLTFTAPTSGVGNFLLRIVQDATGGRTITWPATVRWPGGVGPTVNTATSTIHIVSFYYSGALYYGVGSLSFA